MLLKIVANDKKWLEEFEFLMNKGIGYDKYKKYLIKNSPEIYKELELSEYKNTLIQQPGVSEKLKLILSNGFSVGLKHDYLQFALKVHKYDESLRVNWIGAFTLLKGDIFPLLSHVIDEELFPIADSALLKEENRETLQYLLDVIYQNYVYTEHIIGFIRHRLIPVMKVFPNLLENKWLLELKIISEIIFSWNKDILYKKRKALEYIEKKTDKYENILDEAEFKDLYNYLYSLNALNKDSSVKIKEGELAEYKIYTAKGNQKLEEIYNYFKQYTKDASAINNFMQSIIKHINSADQLEQVFKMISNGILLKTPLRNLNTISVKKLFDQLTDMGYVERKNVPTVKIVELGNHPLILDGYDAQECRYIATVLNHSFEENTRLSTKDFSINSKLLLEHLRHKGIIDEQDIIQKEYRDVSEIAIPYLTPRQNKILFEVIIASKKAISTSSINKYILQVGNVKTSSNE